MSYLDEYHTLSLQDIERYRDLQQSEHLHLEFKLVKDSSFSGKEDRKTLATCLSGFANAAGGLIVWGVDARRDEEGIDRVVGLQPIAKLRQFVARLSALTNEATDPYISGVTHRPIDAGGDSGYAITLVPESDVGPHMAKCGENRYYKRNGDNFCKMEHFDIADMFGRRRKPKLEVFYSVRETRDRLSVHIGVRNVGRATARAPFLSFQTTGPVQRCTYGLDGNHNEGLPLLRGARTGYAWTYAGGMDFALHPGMSHSIANLSLGIPQRESPKEDVIVDYVIACEDQPLEPGRITIPRAELV